MSALPARRAASTARRPRRPQLRVVEAPRHNARYVVVLLVVGALGIFGVVSLNAFAAEAAFEARALERETEALSADYDELVGEVAALESPERIRTVATNELGMVPAERATFLYADRPLPTDRPARGPTSGALADPLKPVLGTSR